MNINNFPKLKQRHIVLWRIAVFAYLFTLALPYRMLLWVLDYPLELIYNVCCALWDTLGAWVEITTNIWHTLVRAAKICAYLPHATAEEGVKDGK